MAVTESPTMAARAAAQEVGVPASLASARAAPSDSRRWSGLERSGPGAGSRRRPEGVRILVGYLLQARHAEARRAQRSYKGETGAPTWPCNGACADGAAVSVFAQWLALVFVEFAAWMTCREITRESASASAGRPQSTGAQ